MSSSAFAVDVDLTTEDASGSIGAATFVQTDPQPTGTGVIKPFVRIQANGSEQGFNTDYSTMNGDLADVKAGAWTHSIHVSDLTPIDYNGTPSYQFLLDINQTSANSLLSLDELRLYTSGIPDHNTNAGVFAENLIYDMGANRILLDYGLNTGSGSGDMYCYLPVSLFAGLGNQYLYLYSKFGASGGDYRSNDGFEEWAYISYPVGVQPSTWSNVKSLYQH